MFRTTCKIKTVSVFLSILPLVTALAIFTITSNAEAKMLNKFKKGFYFEKYKTAEEAKAELLKMHPIGSDVEGLIRTLEMAGAEVLKVDLNEYYSYRKSKKYAEWWGKDMKNIYDIRYDRASPSFVILNWIKWNGTIQVDQNKKLLDLGMYKGRAY